jgi:hypothetical protein
MAACDGEIAAAQERYDQFGPIDEFSATLTDRRVARVRDQCVCGIPAQEEPEDI